MQPLETIDDPVHASRLAGLRYVSDAQPGIRRKRRGRGFTYLDPAGKPIHDKDVLARIKSLAIPPAWACVWICPLANGHLQATGRDAKRRKQSRYHPRWREVRDENKYERMKIFGEALPLIRRQVDLDLGRPGLPREKVLATIVRLLETTFIRVGNQEYARENHSYGLTTLRTRHVDVDGATVHFNFKGKSGVRHSIDLDDRQLARVVKRCLDLPGYELFQYMDECGAHRTVDAADVNDYLGVITGQHFTAKDFRTWAGTVLACAMLRSCEKFETESEAKKNVVRAIAAVAERLGNTPTVCRKCYVHPAVISSYLAGEMGRSLRKQVEKAAVQAAPALRDEELDLLHLLERRLKTAA
jgi:DNA topoisomerase-1